MEEVDGLLSSFYQTLEIQEDKAVLCRHDLMFQVMQVTKRRVFPVHQVLSDSISKEWAYPERKPFFPIVLNVYFLLTIVLNFYRIRILN